jgi:hypothetical protein
MVSQKKGRKKKEQLKHKTPHRNNEKIIRAARRRKVDSRKKVFPLLKKVKLSDSRSENYDTRDYFDILCKKTSKKAMFDIDYRRPGGAELVFSIFPVSSATLALIRATRDSIAISYVSN